MSCEDIRSLSSSASSFSKLDDNESIMDRSITPINSIDDSIESEMDEMTQMKLKIALLEGENRHMRTQKTITNMEEFKKEMSGVWKISSSTNIDEYLEKNKGSEIFDIIFQTCDKTIEFNGDDDDCLTLFDNIGSKRYNISTVKLSKPTFTQKSAHVTFISDNCLKTISISENLEQSEQNQYVENDQLYIVIKRFGIECCRIYSRFKNYKLDELEGKTQKEWDEMKEQLNTLKIENEQMKETLKIQNDEECKKYEILAELFNGKWRCKMHTVDFEITGKEIKISGINTSFGSYKAVRTIKTFENRIYTKSVEPDGRICHSHRYEIVDGNLIWRRYGYESWSKYQEHEYKRVE